MFGRKNLELFPAIKPHLELLSIGSYFIPLKADTLALGRI